MSGQSMYRLAAKNVKLYNDTTKRSLSSSPMQAPYHPSNKHCSGLLLLLYLYNSVRTGLRSKKKTQVLTRQMKWSPLPLWPDGPTPVHF